MKRLKRRHLNGRLLFKSIDSSSLVLFLFFFFVCFFFFILFVSIGTWQRYLFFPFFPFSPSISFPYQFISFIVNRFSIVRSYPRIMLIVNFLLEYKANRYYDFKLPERDSEIMKSDRFPIDLSIDRSFSSSQ